MSPVLRLYNSIYKVVHSKRAKNFLDKIQKYVKFVYQRTFDAKSRAKFGCHLHFFFNEYGKQMISWYIICFYIFEIEQKNEIIFKLIKNEWY